MKKRCLLCLLCLIIFLVAVPAYASTSAQIHSRLEEISATTGYKVGTKNDANYCWCFVNNVSNQLYGVSIPLSPNGYVLGSLGSNWYQVDQVGSGKATSTAVTNLLKKAQAGDIIQYKCRKASWQHTAMVYAVSNSGISIYESAPPADVNYQVVRLWTCSWDEVFSHSWDYGIGKFWDDYGNVISGYGITLYRCNKDVKSDGIVSGGIVSGGGSTSTNPPTSTVSATVTTGSADDVTSAGAILRGSFTATGARATKCGMYIGTSAEVSKMTELGSDSVNTYGTNMYYSTSKYGYKLTAGTMYYYRAYAIVNNKTYWGDAKSFFVPISIGIGIKDVDTTEEEKSGDSGSNTSGHQSLTLGSTGDDVKTMQTMLNSVTFAKLSVDGSFGNNTLKALKNYQTQRGLTVDGVCGAKTWSALESDYKSGKKYCTHTSSKFLSYEAAHPHYNYYQCNTCGEKFTDGTTVKVDSCTTCNPVTAKATVTTKGADNITQTSAIVRGEVTVSSGKLTECGMFIGKTPDSLAFMGRDYISKGTPFYYSTSKFNYPLTAGTTYYYRAYAFVDGEAIWGEMKSFTTVAANAA